MLKLDRHNRVMVGGQQVEMFNANVNFNND